jgi:predicted peptidase
MPTRTQQGPGGRRASGAAVARRAALVVLALAMATCHPAPPRPPTPYAAQPVLGTWLLRVTAGESGWGFYLYLPDDYDTSGASYPLLVHLRGWGNFGWEPNPPLLAGGPLAPLRRSDRALDAAGRERLDPRVRRSIVAVPRLPYFDPGYSHPLGHYSAESVQKLVDWVAAHYRVDRRRLYLTGVSDGGGGVWEYAAAHPEAPAAIVPIACALRVPATPGMREVPTWMFHNFGDDHEENSDPAFQAVTGVRDVLAGYPHAGGDPARPAAGDYTIAYDPVAGLGPWRAGVGPPAGRVNYTLYAAAGHDAATRTFANEAVWRWLYAQTRDPSGASR